jgi:AcrR family transcriptional regulator
MSPRTEKQFEEIRDSRRLLIEETALQLFARQGYHETSIANIANKAGISKGLIYNYYQGKEDLLNAVIDNGLAQIVDLMDPNHDGEMTRNEMEFMINESFRILRENPTFWALYFSLLPQASVFPIVSEKLQVMSKTLIGMMAEYFRKKGAKDPEAEAAILGSMLDGIAVNYTFNREGFPLDAVRKRLIQMYC